LREAVEALFLRIKEDTDAQHWSRGVLLARGGDLRAHRTDAFELQITLVTPGGLVSPTVTFWLDDKDFSCSCPAGGDGCAHAAAAIICLREAVKEGKDLPEPKRGGRASVGYRFERAQGGLYFRRELLVGSRTIRLVGTLVSAEHGPDAVKVLVTQKDAAIEQLLLSNRREGVLPHSVMRRLVELLVGLRDVTLDGAPVQCSAVPLLPVARVSDDQQGFRVTLEPDPTITEVFGNGIALADNTLRAFGETGLTAREMQELPGGKIYTFNQAIELVSRVLPELKRRIPVDVRAKRLPTGKRDLPRAHVFVDRIGDTLSVLPTVVYGDPPMARVDGNQLTLLREGPVPVRDTDLELNVVRKLQRDLGLQPGRRLEATGAQGLALADRIRAWGGVVSGAGLEGFYLRPPLTVQVEAGPGGLDVWFAVEGSKPSRERHDVSTQKVLEAFRQGESLVPLFDGGFAAIPADWLAKHGQRLADFLAARDAARSEALPAHLAPEAARLCDELEIAAPPSFAELRRALETFHGLPDLRLPERFTGVLRSYQELGVRWLAFLRQTGLGGLLADDMGLGKTVQVLAALRGKSLLVVPTSVLQNWAKEAARFRPDLRVSQFYGPNRALDRSADIVLTTYGVLRQDADLLASVEWDTAVIDEAQTIKNPASQTAKAAFGLRAKARVAMTGTPVENRLDELWSQFHFTNRGLLGTLADFRERYADAIGRGEPGAADRLRQRIRPFLLRRTKREVAKELPPRTDMVLQCELAPAERGLYDGLLASMRDDIVAMLGQGGSVLEALEALLRLRQACCHPALLPGQSAETSSKMELLTELLEEALSEGHKVLVFSQWTSLLDLTEPHLRKLGERFLRLDGSTRDRQGVVDAFQAPGGPPVLLLSLKAGGVGLNLTAADIVVLLDPWWNPAVEDQAADRAHRIGQDRPVLVYRLVATNTVEERILALQERKRELAAAAVGSGAHAAGLTRDDLLSLLSG
jgi:superfamily II DNA or RNA helicase